MKERPIIFNTENVKAILDGRKTQTRRVIKPQPNKPVGIAHDWEWKPAGMLCYDDYFRSHAPNYCPYGQVGDRLWVRETLEYSSQGIPTRYGADGCPVMRDGESIDWPFKKSPLPSIFMPRWASRITLEITDIRVERLQEITHSDCIKEGIIECAGNTIPFFKSLWDSLNIESKYPWDSNPWVWCIAFKRV